MAVKPALDPMIADRRKVTEDASAPSPALDTDCNCTVFLCKWATISHAKTIDRVKRPFDAPPPSADAVEIGETTVFHHGAMNAESAKRRTPCEIRQG